MSAEPEVAIQTAFGRVLRDHVLCERFAAAPEATLAELGVDPRSREGMLAAGHQRLLAYHEMAHTRLAGTVETFVGPAATALGVARLHADVRDWVAAEGSRTAYLRDVPAEFLAWVRPRWEEDAQLPAWISELAAHQVSIRMIRNDPRAIGAASDAGLELDRPIVCNGTIRVFRYRFAVHRIKAALGPGEVPDAVAAGDALIGFRAPKDERPTFLEIKARSGMMLERLMAGETLREALFGACEAMGEGVDDRVLGVTAVTLADLSERGVLLGGG